MNQKDIKYFLTPDEFSVLLAARSMSRFYGLSRIDYQVSDKELCMALHKMYVNQIIQNQNNEGFMIDTELAEIMDEIKKARRELVIKYELENGAYNICVLPSDDLVVLAEAPSTPDQIAIFCIEQDELMQRAKDIMEKADVSITLINTIDGSAIKKWKLAKNSENGIDTFKDCCKEAMKI